MTRGRTNIVFGWHSPAFAIHYYFSRDASHRLGRAVLFGLLLWLWWCLPYFKRDETGEGYRLLAFYVNVVRGPYVCAHCGRATTNGPDLNDGAPATCSRKACFFKTYGETP